MKKILTYSQQLWMVIALLFAAISCTPSTELVTPDPVASFTYFSAVTGVGQTIILTNTSKNAESYYWTCLPDRRTSTDKDPSFFFHEKGVYEITLVVTKGNVASFSKQSVTIIGDGSKPLANFYYEPEFPQPGQEVKFKSLSWEAYSFKWSSPEGFDSEDRKPTFAFGQPGVFPVTLTITDDHGVSHSTTREIYVGDRPLLAVTADFSFGPENPKTGEEVKFTNTSKEAVSYLWKSVPEGFTSVQKEPSFTFMKPGTYKVSLTAVGAVGNMQTITKEIKVTGIDLTTFGDVESDFEFLPEKPKAGEKVTFKNLSLNALTYKWSSDPDEFNSTAKDPTHTFTKAGTYKVTLTATGPKGTSSYTTTIKVE